MLGARRAAQPRRPPRDVHALALLSRSRVQLTVFDVAALGAGMVTTAPVRPVQHRCWRGWTLPDERLQYMSRLGNGERQEVYSLR